MTTKQCMIVLALFLFFSFGFAQRLDVNNTQIGTSTPAVITPAERWINDLKMCESGGNPNAINEEDLDGTPSYGCFQFKPGTFSYFSSRYNLYGDLMDCEAQKSLVRRMVAEAKSINWHRQFPDCVAKLGLPPAVDKD